MRKSEHEERLFCVKYVESLERDREEIKKAMQLLNHAGVASGNEHLDYSLSERIEWLVKVRDYQRRKLNSALDICRKSPNMLRRVNDEIFKTGGARSSPEQTDRVVKTARI